MADAAPVDEAVRPQRSITSFLGARYAAPVTDSVILAEYIKTAPLAAGQANECLRSSYGPPAPEAFDDAEHAASLGASRVSPALLAEQAAERLRVSQCEEADAMAADGDDDALAEQELREVEEEAILEGPAPPIKVVDADEDNMVVSDGSGIAI
ncbi:uncharacterized protein BDZ99DRAFT_568930 [Mytilinidion resinicola]|uniref:Uncharacterized protein n=1 Tax=Mytilinidion resinicola TaxID=574789 RepID=A0A6A6YTR8_9PEZI|nr:uncharacterized protein BDZ99DRAFT_568930 [Mytilinidion resinicola]KAF2812200.1 hypothetical protein BDZ99DRAFT_568930 [Mytilinidion resinicola]